MHSVSTDEIKDLLFIFFKRGNNGFDLDIDEESTMLEDYVTPSK